ncbi:MAG: NUDIX hydrolase [Flavobacterium sp.]
MASFTGNIMDFLDFVKYVPKIEKEKLLAAQAHIKMAPRERIAAMEKVNLQSVNPKKAAVMILMYPKNNKTHLVLILRNSYPSVHSSQIAFPGGKVEPTDSSLQETALRETHEEIGVDPEKIEIIRPFSEIYIPPSNFLVFPFLGISKTELTFKPQLDEVADIIEFSITDFLDEKTVVMKKMNTSYAYDIEVPTFKISDHYVWGATAMILSEFKEVMKNIISHDIL